jgi:hypothetical protein
MEEQGKRRQQNGWCLVNGEQVRRFLLLPHPRCKLEPRYEFIRVITIGIHGNQHGQNVVLSFSKTTMDVKDVMRFYCSNLLFVSKVKNYSRTTLKESSSIFLHQCYSAY